MATGFVWHERYMWHDTGTAAGMVPAGGYNQPFQHFESAESKRRFRNLLEVTGLDDSLVAIKPRMATEAEALRFHTPEYLAHVKKYSEIGNGDGGELAPIGRNSWEIALLSAGGCFAAVDAVMRGQVRNAYVLNRPPGHHAEADRGRGYCLLGNVALTAMHLQAAHGLTRIATVDWDVHHGNGTQSAFYGRKDVLTISLHQDRCYPHNSGFLEENGEGAGKGYNLNIPLPPGSGHAAYIEAVERVVLPALRAYKPEFILVPSGFDASAMDPLGRQMAHSDTYRVMAGQLMQAADELCDGRLVLCHEGGYSPVYVPWCGLATVETLTGIRTDAVDPYLAGFCGILGGQDLQPHQEVAIAAAAKLVAKIGA